MNPWGPAWLGCSTVLKAPFPHMWRPMKEQSMAPTLFFTLYPLHSSVLVLIGSLSSTQPLHRQWALGSCEGKVLSCKIKDAQFGKLIFASPSFAINTQWYAGCAISYLHTWWTGSHLAGLQKSRRGQPPLKRMTQDELLKGPPKSLVLIMGYWQWLGTQWEVLLCPCSGQG